MTKTNTRKISRTLPKKAEIAKLEANAIRACTLLKAMANPTRLIILCQIAHGERSVGDLAQAVGQRQSGLSQQLTLLRHNHLVVARRAGQNVYYSLASDDAASIMQTLYEILCRQRQKRAYFDPALRPG